MRAALVLLSSICAADSAALVKHLLTDAQAAKYGAYALDGTPYAYYSTPLANGTRDWIVYLQGGGECEQMADCAKRAVSFSAQGTSRGAPPTVDGNADVSDGMTSSDCKINPHFCEFGTLYLPYLSGDDWLGAMDASANPFIPPDVRANRTAASGAEPKCPVCPCCPTCVPCPACLPLWFSGHNNVRATLQLSLFKSIVSGGGKLRSVLLSGGSAGGQGAYFHADWLADELKQLSPATKVLVNPQYGWFTPVTTTFPDWKAGKQTDPALPYPSSANPTSVPDWLTNVKTFLPKRCLAALSPDQAKTPLLCGNSVRVAATIAAPLFVSTNLMDAWLAGVEQQCCGPFFGKDKIKQTDAEYKYLMAVTTPVVSSTVRNASAIDSQHRGAFVPCCLAHGMDWTSKTVVKGCNHMEAVSSWFFGAVTAGGKDYSGNVVKKCDRVIVDGPTLSVPALLKLPCNKGQFVATR